MSGILSLFPSAADGGRQNPVDPASNSRHDRIRTYDAIVLGCGVSGLVAASILTRQRHDRVLVVDEYPHVGGNHIDQAIGPYTFDVGSFLFQDDSPLLRHLPELLPHYVEVKPSWARLNPQGVVTRYPISIQDDLIAAGALEWARMLASVAKARLFQRDRSNARDFARYWIGERLLERTGLETYLGRFYGVPAERIDIRFAESRMAWVKEHGRLRTLLPRLRGLLRPASVRRVNRQLARPREGFGQLYKASREKLERDGATFLLGTRLRDLKRSADGLVLETAAGLFRADRVLSTIPIDRALALCGLREGGSLPFVTLLSLFFSFAGDRGFEEAILYNFSQEGAWKRLTVYSDFYGPADGREYLTVEVNAELVGGSVERAERDFRDHGRRNGLFAGDLRLEGSFRLENAYPVYVEQADAHAERGVARLHAFGVESFGRQGAFQYQPTARVTTLEVEAALKAT